MTADDILTWISFKNETLFALMQTHAADDEKWDRFKGAMDVLQELRLHILMKTNPHNREDIKRVNEKLDNDQRIEMQYEILQLLARKYYNMGAEDEIEAHDMARSDSYEIMKIIYKYWAIGNEPKKS